MTTTAQCDSCGDLDVAVADVRRVYLADLDGADLEGTTISPDTGSGGSASERWCEVCRLHYPHEPC